MVESMITVNILMNGQPIYTRSAKNVKKMKGDMYQYKLDDGSEIVHNRKHGAIKLAIKMLKQIKEV